jgi:hypothetical protein
MTTTSIALKRVDPIKLGAVLGVTYFVIGLLAAIVLICASLVTSGAVGWLPQPSTAALSLPFAYGIAAFILGALCAAIYNLVAKWTGGVEFSVETSQQEQHV